MSEGYVKIPRSVFDHPLFFLRKEKEGQCPKWRAWMDLFRLASYTNDNKQWAGEKLMTLQVGEVAASFRYLEERWGWSKKKIAKFLGDMERDGFIKVEKRQGQNVLFLCNYWLPNNNITGKETELQTPKGDTKETPKRHQRDTKETKLIRENKEEQLNNIIKIKKEKFEEFRVRYPGHKRGHETEFAHFKKKHKDWKEIIPLLLPAIEKEIQWRAAMNEIGQFVPQMKHLQTWINNRNWENELPAIPQRNQQNGKSSISDRSAYDRIKQNLENGEY